MSRVADQAPNRFLCLACARVLQPEINWQANLVCACGQEYELDWEDHATLTEPQVLYLLTSAEPWPRGELAHQD